MSLVKNCQAFLLVSGIFLNLKAEENPFSLKGGFLKDDIKSYTWQQIHNLREAVKPRPIVLFDSYLYQEIQTYVAKGILFTVKAPFAKEVFFISDVYDFKRKPMRRGKKGVWYYLYIPEPYGFNKPSQKLRYKFEVDGFYIVDETHQERENDGVGGSISLYYLTEDDLEAKTGTLLGKTMGYGREVLFRVKAPNAKEVSLLGSFNQWNSQMDRLEEEKPGIFVIRKHLPFGEHYYLYQIDGKKQFDLNSKETRYHPVLGRVSYLKVE